MLCTGSQVEIGHKATVHTLLDGKIDDRLLLAILDTRDTCLIALLVVELHVLDDIDGNIFQGRFHVAQHKFLTVEQNLLHGLAVNRDITILIDLGTRDALDEFIDRRPLGCTVGVRVIDQCVLLDNNLCGTACHDSFFQHDRLGRHE